MGEENHERDARVTAAVWPWRTPPAKAAAHGAGPRRALVEAAVSLAVAAVLLHGFHKPVLATVVVCVAMTMLATGILAPRVYRGIQSGGVWLGKAVGAIVSWTILGILFYVVFTARRAWLALRGKDPLTRRFPGAEASYWVSRETRPDPERYRKQY